MGVRLRNSVVISLVCEVEGIERLNESILVVVELFQRDRGGHGKSVSSW